MTPNAPAAATRPGPPAAPTPPVPAAGPAPAGAPAGAPAAAPLIQEWHCMTSQQRQVEWAALVAWVVWIHDLYELSREERLRPCWARHPGLVEELRSLKAWRGAVYGSPETAAAAHTPRSWHGEFRQTILAVGMFWTNGCGAGHDDATLLADTDPNLQQEWLAVGPPLMASSPQPDQDTAAEPLLLPHPEMAAALATGRARQHSRGMPYHATLDGHWWTREPGGGAWLRCTDPAQHAAFEESAARLRLADAAVDRHHHRQRAEPSDAPRDGHVAEHRTEKGQP